MKDIALFLISSVLTPATLAAGQATCLLATQIKVTSPLYDSSSATGLTVTSSSSGRCVAISSDMPMRPAAFRQTSVPLLASKKTRYRCDRGEFALKAWMGEPQPWRCVGRSGGTSGEIRSFDSIQFPREL
jgi:hypothetical protein